MEFLGKYRIEAKLGQGAMGCVYKAWHPGFHDYVALKTIQDTRLEGAQLLERFKREGQALAKLKHQNIVQIYDADQAEGIHFIVMEYMNGGSLDRIIERRDSSPLAKKVGYILPTCRALSYAHRRGLFHRDIKPANIMLHHDGSDEIVKVVDFGIARLVDLNEKQDFALSQTNMLIGAPAYMAPELLIGTSRANEKTDIWALGATLYELISYERPFHGNDFDELRRDVIHNKTKSLCQLVPGCPSDLDAVVQRMIDKDPSRRYPTVEDLLVDLEPIAKRLCAEAADTLIHRANDLCEIGEVESAKSLLTEARKYDPTNTQLRELLQKVDQELRRRDLLPRLYGHLKQARDFADAENYDRARQEIAAALTLDPNFDAAKKYLEEIEEGAKKKEFISEKLRQTRQRVAEGALTQAEMLLREAEALDGSNTQISELHRQIEEERLRRERRKRLNEVTSRAQVLLAALKYEECLELVNRTLVEFPGDGELRKLQVATQDAAAEASQKLQRQQGVDEVRRLLSKGDHEQALSKAQQLLLTFPNDVVIDQLKALAKDGIEKDKRQRRLNDGVNEVQFLLSQGRAGTANKRFLELLKEYPGDAKLHELRRSIDFALEKDRQREAQEQELNRKRAQNEAIEEGIRFVRKKTVSKKFAEAVAAAEKLALQFPTESRVRGILQEASSAQEEHKKQELVQQAVKEIRQKINKEQYEQAIDQATGILAECGRQEQIETLLKAAEVELRDQRIRREAEENRFSETRTLLANGRSGEALDLVQNAIATNIFKKSDPRVVSLLSDIRNWKESCVTNEQLLTQEKEIALPEDAQGAPQHPPLFQGASTGVSSEYTIELPELENRQDDLKGGESDPHRGALDLQKLLAFLLAPKDKPWLIRGGVAGLGLLGLILIVVWGMSIAKSKREAIAFHQATQDEQLKKWPLAAEEFKGIQQAGGDHSIQAEQEYKKLAGLLEEEQTLKAEAEKARAAGDYQAAENSLIQLANLHGDMEADALAEKGDVEKEARATGPKRAERSGEEKSAKSSASAVVTKSTACEIPASDVPYRLQRAGKNRAAGDFEDAILEYESVLRCEPKNRDALTGLERARNGRNN